jgi:hypothetical protein
LALGGTRSQHDANGLLDILKDARINFRLMTLGRAIDDPNVITSSAAGSPAFSEIPAH